jgi:phage-related protein
MNETKKVKHLDFVGSSREDLREFPDEVKQDVGYALFVAQLGRKAVSAKPLKGFDGASVLEVVEDFRGGTYRAMYTVRFLEVIYVLHCFQKKSRHGIETPKQDLDLVRQRLKAAEEDHRIHYGEGGRT